jgi:hypothetical protein
MKNKLSITLTDRIVELNFSPAGMRALGGLRDYT